MAKFRSVPTKRPMQAVHAAPPSHEPCAPRGALSEGAALLQRWLL